MTDLGVASDRGPAKRIALVINAASRSAAAVAQELQDHLRRRAEIVAIAPRDPQDVTRAIEKVRDEVDLIVAAGGDGTLHYVARALVHAQTPLAVVPLGTANDFARSVQIPTDLDAALDVAFNGRDARVDVGCVNGVPYLNSAGIGVIEEVTDHISSGRKKILGSLEYVYAAARTVVNAEPFEARIEIDGQREARRCLQILVGNSRYFGPMMEVTPDARVDDGLLHVCILDASSTLELIAAAFHLLRGDHDQAEKLEVRTATRVRIDTGAPRAVYADGECVERTPATIEVIPGGLLVRAPHGTDLS